MKLAQVQSRCECQATLFAEVQETGQVVRGSSQKKGHERELSPATGIGVGGESFQVGWHCPECGRNVLRSFSRGGLVFREVSLDPRFDTAPLSGTTA